jgi:sterol carrier protein 2
MWVKSGAADVALALGFERMAPGSLGSNFTDRPTPMAPFYTLTAELESGTVLPNSGPNAPRMFANGAQEYFDKHPGAGIEHLAKIASKNHRHSVNNPYSQFRDGWSVEQVLNAKKINRQLTMYMCSPTSDGAACCIVATEAFVKAHGLENQAIEIVSQVCGDMCVWIHVCRPSDNGAGGLIGSRYRPAGHFREQKRDGACWVQYDQGGRRRRVCQGRLQAR